MNFIKKYIFYSEYWLYRNGCTWDSNNRGQNYWSIFLHNCVSSCNCKTIVNKKQALDEFEEIVKRGEGGRLKKVGYWKFPFTTKRRCYVEYESRLGQKNFNEYEHKGFMNKPITYIEKDKDRVYFTFSKEAIRVKCSKEFWERNSKEITFFIREIEPYLYKDFVHTQRGDISIKDCKFFSYEERSLVFKRHDKRISHQLIYREGVVDFTLRKNNRKNINA